MINRKIFSQRLKQLRTDNGLSMQELAQIVGLKNKGSIGQFETCLNTPSADVLVALADYFNVSVDYLVGRTDTPYNEVYVNNFKLYFEPEGTLEYTFDNNDETLRGSLKYTFGYYNAIRNFLLLEQVEGNLISEIINSQKEVYFLYIVKLLTTNLKIPYNYMSNKVDIFFSFQGEYKELEVGKKETTKAHYIGVLNALPKDNENISKWLKKPVSERKHFWRKEVERIFTQGGG